MTLPPQFNAFLFKNDPILADGKIECQFEPSEAPFTGHRGVSQTVAMNVQLKHAIYCSDSNGFLEPSINQPTLKIRVTISSSCWKDFVLLDAWVAWPG